MKYNSTASRWTLNLFLFKWHRVRVTPGTRILLGTNLLWLQISSCHCSVRTGCNHRATREDENNCYSFTHFWWVCTLLSKESARNCNKLMFINHQFTRVSVVHLFPFQLAQLIHCTLFIRKLNALVDSTKVIASSTESSRPALHPLGREMHRQRGTKDTLWAKFWAKLKATVASNQFLQMQMASLPEGRNRNEFESKMYKTRARRAFFGPVSVMKW